MAWRVVSAFLPVWGACNVPSLAGQTSRCACVKENLKRWMAQDDSEMLCCLAHLVANQQIFTSCSHRVGRFVAGLPQAGYAFILLLIFLKSLSLLVVYTVNRCRKRRKMVGQMMEMIDTSGPSVCSHGCRFGGSGRQAASNAPNQPSLTRWSMPCEMLPASPHRYHACLLAVAWRLVVPPTLGWPEFPAPAFTYR